ncbi:fungal-specific transcription factor domain-containing protein, partial [Halteromyces radiatus]|uniref:fungal-specific transcription factor domain-containing protein n=1 Tax=Halteromyces radiatus TaxID=101107 RepID=UPI00222121A9
MDANGQYRYLGKSSGFYLLQKSRTYHHGAFHLSAYQRNSSRSISSSPSFLSPVPPCPPNVDPYELPSSELSTTLIRLYFRYFYPVLPIFYKQQLSSSMDDPAEPISPLLLNAIYAVASRVCDDIEIRSDPTRPETAGDIFFERAKYLLDSHYDIPRVSTVQALLLLASHQQGTMKSARAWLYSGMAFRMALDLGLNRNCDHWQIPSDEKERRKRVFWCCFVVDRLASATFGRSSTFEESDCDTPFPINDDDEPVFTPNPTQHTIYMKPPGPLVALSHLVKICDILGHVLKNIYYAKALQHSDMRHISQIVSVLAGRLAHWYKNLPPSLRMDNYTQQQQDVTYPVCVPQLHMVYHTAVILLHRLFISNNPADASPESISEYNTCAISATAIMNIANSMLKNNTLKYVFHSVVYFIFTSGIIFINSASSNDATKSFDAKVNINNIMRLLDELEKTWPSAARCSTILGELAGLRELNLPTSENTLRPIVQKSNHSSPMSSPSAAEINLGPSTAASTITTTSSSSEMANIDKTKRRIPGIDRKQWNQHSIMMGSLSDEIRSGTSFSDSSPDLGYRISSPRDLQQQQQQQSTYTKGNMDPFAAPDTIPVPSQRQQFDLSGAAFWGVPPSLDLDEWSHYLG